MQTFTQLKVTARKHTFERSANAIWNPHGTHLGQIPTIRNLERWQRHIDACSQCRRDPRNLCKDGAAMISQVCRRCKGLGVVSAPLTQEQISWGIVHKSVRCPECGPPEPWYEPVLRALADLEPGWNSYAAARIDQRSIAAARSVLEDRPGITPTTQGGVQIEWHTRSGDYELVILADGSQEIEGEPQPLEAQHG